MVAVVIAIYAPELLVQLFSSGSWGGVTFSALGTTTIAGTTLTTLDGAVVGAIAGFSAGFLGSLAGGASFGDAVNIGLKAAFAGAITGGIGAHYGNTWNLERVAFHSLGGGAGSEVSGGSFKDGFKLAGALALVSWGYSEMTRITNELKLKSIANNPEESKLYTNSHGEIYSSGGRGFGRNLKVGEYDSWLSRYGMDSETIEKNFDGGILRFINKVSKTHDFQNSWHYNWDTGFFQPFTSQIGAEVFEIYSFLGMPIAGVYTTVAIGSDQILVTSQIYKGRKYE